MREFIVENLINAQTVSVAEILLNNVVALAFSFFLMFTYRLTYDGPSYSRKFNHSLGAITIITALIMSVISNNVALSLGMVGALSIIRFRTAVKDVRDAVYIFWSIAAGIGCGVSQYALVAIGSLFLFFFFLLTRNAPGGANQLLIVEGKPEAQNDMAAVVDTHFDGKAHLTMKNMTESSCEMIFRITDGLLKKANEKAMMDITERLLKVEGVRRVNLVEQQDNIAR